MIKNGVGYDILNVLIKDLDEKKMFGVGHKYLGLKIILIWKS